MAKPSRKTCPFRRVSRTPQERQLARAMLARLRGRADLRQQKVRRVKQAVGEQTYLNTLKVEIAIERLARELRS